MVGILLKINLIFHKYVVINKETIISRIEKMINNLNNRRLS